MTPQPEPETLEHIHAAKSRAWWCNCTTSQVPPNEGLWYLCLFHEGYDAAVRALRDRLTTAGAVEAPQVPGINTGAHSG